MAVGVVPLLLLTAALLVSPLVQGQDEEEVEKTGTECRLNNRVFRSGVTFQDGCNLCRCRDGVLACAGGAIRCRYLEGQATPPPPGGCKHENKQRLNGEIFLAEDGCSRCWCLEERLRCKAVTSETCSNFASKRRSLELDPQPEGR